MDETPVVVFPSPIDVGPQGPPGAVGPQGPPGQPRWSGDGPPPQIIPGAQPGDSYLDRLTGDVYTLR